VGHGVPDAVLSIIPGGGKWVEVVVRADPLYQHLLLTAEKKFWQSGEEPRLFGVEPPRPRLEAVRSVDMSGSNSWAEFSATYGRTREAYLEHEGAKAELSSGNLSDIVHAAMSRPAQTMGKTTAGLCGGLIS
jgi:hypothetical protein